MREVINFNTKWAFTKEATEVPKEMPEEVVLGNTSTFLE